METARATYRLQLRGGLGFDEVAALADYLDDLGVSHVYASPYLQAAAGSTHGYDVVDPRRLDAALGGDAGHARMTRALAARGLGQLLDIVPNHMAIGTADNAWWWDVLEHGPSSRYAGHFDVDWHETGDNRVLLPILGERYADALVAGVVRIVREGAGFVVRVYDDHRLPVAPRALAEPLGRVAARTGSTELGFLADALGAMPSPRPHDRAVTERRHRDREVITALLARLFEARPDLAAAVDEELAAIGASFASLDDFLEHQNWRLGYWRTALAELRHRRFFDIATLAGLRVEEPEVFDDVHARVLAWLADGTLDGVRIDHVDGLRDPTGYLQRLRGRAPDAWIVVEKIVAPGEELPAAWPVEGTTGYEVARLLDGVLIEPAGARALAAAADAFGAGDAPWPEAARQARLDVIEELLAGERDRLVGVAAQVIARRPALRDVGARELRDALTELLASYPVYRSYVRAGAPAGDADRATVEAAIAAAARHQPEVDRRLWGALRDVLLLEVPDPGPAELELALRLQQTTGAVMAKGIEDTLFYRQVALAGLDEVGGAPERGAVSLDELHAALAARVARPRALLATATHDTKRGEDVRARLAVLSEVPDAWAAAVQRWSRRARRHRDGELPDPRTEYLLWQTIAGAWPVDADRLAAYAEKAVREAKRRTSWLRPDPAYEGAVRRFCAGVLGDRELVADVEAFVATIAPAGWRNALARTLVKLTAPGVPDLYQGAELWDLSLVDPDNRRPVDFARRRELLRAARAIADPRDALAGIADGLPKLWLIHRVLDLRRREPAWFEGGYRRLPVRGPEADRVIAFARAERLAVIAPRLTAGAPRWDRTEVVLDGAWTDVLRGRPLDGGGALDLARLLAAFPVALLARRG